MKSATSAMDNLLSTGTSFFMADLYTITLIGGQVFRYTDADIGLTVGGNLFSKTGIIFSRTKTRLTLGLDTATMTIKISADDTQLLLGTPWIQSIRLGKLDGAKIRVERLITGDWTDTSAGSIIMFEGEVRDSQAARLTATITVASASYKFDVSLPKNTYSPSCIHTLFDFGCAVSKTASGVSGTTTSGSTNSIVNSALGNGTDYFALGTITFTGGANNGVSRTVRNFTGGTFNLSLPLPVQPTTGDTFTAYPGCDKALATCTSKFTNTANFRGYPFVPNPETIS